MKSICVVTFFVFSLSINAQNYGILVDDAAKEIILDGSKNPCKFMKGNKETTELLNFATENSGFPWGKYVRQNYHVKMFNVNIENGMSNCCLIWFLNNDFQVTLDRSTIISHQALMLFARSAPQRKDDNFFNLIIQGRDPLISWKFDEAILLLRKKGVSCTLSLSMQEYM